MRNVCQQIRLKSEASVERTQYFQESFHLSLRIQLFPWHILAYT